VIAAKFSCSSMASKREMRGAIAPRALEGDEDAPVGAELDAVLGERGAEEIAAGARDRWQAPTRRRGDRSRRAGPGGGRERWCGLLLRLWLASLNTRPLSEGFEMLWGSTKGGAVRGGIAQAASTRA